MKNLFILFLLALSSTLSYGQKYTAYFFSDGGNVHTLKFDQEVIDVVAGNTKSAIILENDSVLTRSYLDPKIPENVKYKDIELGVYYGMGVSKTNEGYAWCPESYCDNNSEELIFPESLNGNIKKISTGLAHNMVLTKDSLVVAWGSNGQGQTNTPFNLSKVIDIAAGGFFSAVLTEDKKVIKWGRFSYESDGSLDTLTINSDISEIIGGGGYTGEGELYGLTKDSLLIKITEDSSEELPELGKVKDVSVGEGFTFVLKEDNTLEVLEQSFYYFKEYGEFNPDHIRQLENVQWIAAGDCVAVVITKDEILSSEDHISNGQELSDNLKLIPNPALNAVTIITNSGSVSQLQVLSLDGKVVLETSTFGQEHILDLSAFSSGTYLVQIQNEQGVFHNKLVKQ